MPRTVIEPRIYRAAFIPALLALVLTMFSLQSPPRALAPGLAADVVFDGSQGLGAARSVIDNARDRRAGTPGDRAAAAEVADSFRERGFDVDRDRFEGGGRQLENVVARRAGESSRQIVVLAARDAAGVPDATGSGADTAALLEIARVFEGRPSNKTLVLASVDGETLGQLGAARLARQLERPDRVDGILVLSGLGASGEGPPQVQAFATDSTRSGIGLQRSAADSLRQETGAVGALPSALGQLARLAFPLGLGSQAALVADGYDAVRISGGDELPVDGDSGLADFDRERFEQLGRAALRTLTALDARPAPRRGPRTYVTIASQVMPGWVLALLSFTLLAPALVASIDAFARARRRQQPVSAWLAWVGAAVLPFVVGLGLAHLLALSGLIADPPAAPVGPALYPLGLSGATALALVTVVVALLWIALRFLLLRREPQLRAPEAAGGGVAVALVLSAATLALWAQNPFAALLVIPALHLWLLVALAEPTPPRAVKAAMIAGGLILPALLVLYFLLTLGLDPVNGLWYLLLLITGGQVPFGQAMMACLLAGVLCSLLSLARHRRPQDPAAERSVRGPASYAGPGSLGGTESALPRR